MATENLVIAGSLRDAHAAVDAESAELTELYVEIRRTTDDGTRKTGGFKFVSSAISPGDTINAATLSAYVQSTSNDDIDAVVVGDDQDTSPDWSADDHPQDRYAATPTTASTTWTADAMGVGYQTLDVTTIVAEIVARAGWTGPISGMLQGAVGTNKRCRMSSFDNGVSGEYAKLDIDYTASGGGGADIRNHIMQNEGG